MMVEELHTLRAPGVVKEPAATGRRRTLNRVSSEMLVSTGALHVRFDFGRQWLTVAFRPWFDWHVDSVQVELAPGLVHFIEPDGRIVSVKIFQQVADPGEVVIPTQGDVS